MSTLGQELREILAENLREVKSIRELKTELPNHLRHAARNQNESRAMIIEDTSDWTDKGLEEIKAWLKAEDIEMIIEPTDPVKQDSKNQKYAAYATWG